jgi:uncharacterized protein involved in exopolysaccharide biosynthesis
MSTQSIQESDISALLIREPESSVRDILNILFRHKILICVIFLLVSSLTTIITILTPKIYQSTAQLLLRVGREMVSIDPTIKGPSRGVFQEMENETKAEVAILKSHVLAEDVVEKVGVSFILNCTGASLSSIQPALGAGKNERINRNTQFTVNDFSTATGILQNGLSVDHQVKTNIIDLSFRNGDPQCAQMFLNEIIDSYLERHIEVNRMLASPAFFQEQSDKLLEILKSKEGELAKYHERYNIVAIKDQKESLLRQIEILQNQLDIIISGALASGVKIAEIEKNLGRKSPIIELHRQEGQENFTAKDMKFQLINLRMEESDLANRFQDDYRPLVVLREKIAYVESLLAKQPDTDTHVTKGINETHITLEINLENEKANFKYLLAQQDAVSNQLSQRKEEVKALSKVEITINSLLRDIKVMEEEYLAYRDNLQRANISVALDLEKISNVKIVQPATLYLKHIKPNKIQNITIGLLVGLLVGIALAFILEFFDDTMKTNEDVEKRLKLPVLAHVSKDEFESCI